MLNLKVDASDLVKWARLFDDMAEVTPAVIADSLNTFGDGTVRTVAERVANKNGWDVDSVLSRIIIVEASSQNLVWFMDASNVVPPDADWNRDQSWQGRDSSAFEQDTLVNIVTSGDGAVCLICEQAAEESPYTMSQITQMQAQWAGYVPPTPNIAPGVITNLIHPRCRCAIQTWQSTRRMPISFGGSNNAPAELLTMKGLAKQIADEMKVKIRVLKSSVR